MTIGEAIRAARVERSLDQSMLANRLDKTQSWVSRVETDNFLPSVADLDRIAGTLRVDALTLFRAHPDYPVWSKVIGGGK